MNLYSVEWGEHPVGDSRHEEERKSIYIAAESRSAALAHWEEEPFEPDPVRVTISMVSRPVWWPAQPPDATPAVVLDAKLALLRAIRKEVQLRRASMKGFDVEEFEAWLYRTILDMERSDA